MGSLLGKPSNREENSNLKLEAQKIKEFSGHSEEWHKWKSHTECVFEGSGYKNILSDVKYAGQHPRMTRVVYLQLAASTVDGTAYHLVKQHEDTKNGHLAWHAMCDWYDGDTVKNEMAEALRNKLNSLKLHPGTTASQ